MIRFHVARCGIRRFRSLVLTPVVLLTAAGLMLAGCPASGDDDPPVCGDDVCDEGESDACADCAEPEEDPVCGDGVCDEGETSACADCANPVPVCGDGFCDAGEATTCSDCAMSGDATLTVTNNSSYDAYYFYVASCSSSSWGSDQLGTNILDPGEAFQLTDIPPGCYDYRAETAGAATYWEEYGVELSAGEDATWSLTD